MEVLNDEHRRCQSPQLAKHLGQRLGTAGRGGDGDHRAASGEVPPPASEVADHGNPADPADPPTESGKARCVTAGGGRRDIDRAGLDTQRRGIGADPLRGDEEDRGRLPRHDVLYRGQGGGAPVEDQHDHRRGQPGDHLDGFAGVRGLEEADITLLPERTRELLAEPVAGAEEDGRDLSHSRFPRRPETALSRRPSSNSLLTM